MKTGANGKSSHQPKQELSKQSNNVVLDYNQKFTVIIHMSKLVKINYIVFDERC